MTARLRTASLDIRFRMTRAGKRPEPEEVTLAIADAIYEVLNRYEVFRLEEIAMPVTYTYANGHEETIEAVFVPADGGMIYQGDR